MREVIITSENKEPEENKFFEGRCGFKFNNLGLAVGKAFKFYTSVAKVLKLKVKVLGANSSHTSQLE